VEDRKLLLDFGLVFVLLLFVLFGVLFGLEYVFGEERVLDFVEGVFDFVERLLLLLLTDGLLLFFLVLGAFLPDSILFPLLSVCVFNTASLDF